MKATRPRPLVIVRRTLDIAVMGLVVVVLLALILGRLVPAFGGRSLIIGGSSMEPTLPLGSAVVIQPVAPEAIAVGDIVSVQSSDERAIYTHRVTRLLELQGEPYLETKGDNNATPDGATVPAAAVIGRVDRVLPLMGFMLALLSVPSGVAFVLGLGALLILAAILVDAVEHDRPRARPPAAVPASDVAQPARPMTPLPITYPKADVPGGSTLDVGAESVAALVRPRDRRPALGTEPHTAKVRQAKRAARSTRPAA